MENRRPPRAALVVGGILLLIAAYYGIRALTSRDNGRLAASGTIEAVMVDISPELGGRVTEVLVNEGDFADAGAVLVVFDDALLQQQRKAAAAALESEIPFENSLKRLVQRLRNF